MSRIALLDVNVLVALFDPDHIHHDLAHDWFHDYGPGGWATCAVTENGLLRVLTNPAYNPAAYRPADILDRLRVFCASGQHHFWGASVSLANKRLFNASHIRGYRQVTDVYLLGLAKQMGGTLTTFDRTIPVAAVKGATASLVHVIAPGDD